MELDEHDPIKRNSLPYPMELGSPAFAPIAIEKEKDILLNISKLNAKQEYDRIMEQVNVLKRQAEALANRMQVSEIMHQCKYGFKVVHGHYYYVYFNSYKNENVLSLNAPNSWSALPGHYTYIMTVRLMGDSTWEEVEDGFDNFKKE
jgi:hypothetical protein